MGLTLGSATATRSTWFAGTAVTAVTLLAGGWFLAISPTLADAATTRSDATSARERNAVLEVQLAGLAQQHARLPELQAELATLRGQIPATGDLAVLLRELSGLAATHRVTLVAVSPGTPTPVVPGASTAVPAAPTTGTAAPVAGDAPADPAAVPATGQGSTAPSADGSVVPVAPAAPIPGFVAVPVELTVLGSTPDVLAFLGALQRDTHRLFLVAGLTGTGQGEVEATGSQPATESGDVRLGISGYVYVLQDPATSISPVDPGAQPGAAPAGLPTPSSPAFAAD